MKKSLTKIFVLLLSVILLCGCGETWRLNHQQQNNQEYVIGSMRAYVYTYDARQVDSMCVVDKLPRDLGEWTATAYSDYETGKRVVKRMYIKEFSEKEELIYLISEEDERLYKIIKRYVTAE